MTHLRLIDTKTDNKRFIDIARLADDVAELKQKVSLLIELCTMLSEQIDALEEEITKKQPTPS